MSKKTRKKTNPQGKKKVPFLQDRKKIIVAAISIVAVLVLCSLDYH
jgi:hypothetical protein